MVLRASPQKREEKERVRHALLRAALSLGAEHGFSSLGLREVSRAAAIAPTSFYRHFTDMPELGLALVHELVRPLLQGLAAPLPAASLKHASLVEHMFEAVRQDAELVRFIVAERCGSFASLRRALADEVASLVHVLHLVDASRARSERAADAGYVVDASAALLLDGLVRILEAPADELASLQERLIGVFGLVFEDARLEQRKP